MLSRGPNERLEAELRQAWKFFEDSLEIVRRMAAEAGRRRFICVPDRVQHEAAQISLRNLRKLDRAAKWCTAEASGGVRSRHEPRARTNDFTNHTCAVRAAPHPGSTCVARGVGPRAPWASIQRASIIRQRTLCRPSGFVRIAAGQVLGVQTSRRGPTTAQVSVSTTAQSPRLVLSKRGGRPWSPCPMPRSAKAANSCRSPGYSRHAA
jgi:hypothetical protein